MALDSKTTTRFFGQLAERAIAGRWPLLLIFLGIVGASLWASSSLEPNFSLKAFFGQSDPDQEVLQPLSAVGTAAICAGLPQKAPLEPPNRFFFLSIFKNYENRSTK